eukprot:8746992-Prorocentrum_lima.AAC.1
MALKMNCALEPKMIMMMLANGTGKVIKEDDILSRAWSDSAMQPKLRKPNYNMGCFGVCEDNDW